jgi:hypothetical protein
MTADCNALHKEALAKTKVDEQASYDIAYYEERLHGEGVQASAVGT